MDVTIQHCRINVVRHGGWGWGLGRRELTERAVGLLPALLGRQFADVLPDDTELVVDEPIQLNLRLTMREFLDLTENRSDSNWLDRARPQMVRQVHDAIKHSVRPAMESRRLANEAANRLTIDAAAESNETRVTGSPLLKLLMKHHRDGKLAPFLRSLSLPVLVKWHESLVSIQRPPISRNRDRRSTEELSEADRPDSAAVDGQAIDALVAEVARFMQLTKTEQTVVIRTRIVAIIDAVVQLAIAPGDPRLLCALDVHLPLLESEKERQEDEGNFAEAANDDEDAADSRRSVDAGNASPGMPKHVNGSNRVSHVDVQVESILPFLLLGPLSKIGFLDTVSAALDAAGLADYLQALAVGLAYKVLNPPSRGWLRSPASQTAAAAMAGSTKPIADSLLPELARNSESFVSALQTSIGRAVIDGHDPNQPLLLAQVDANQSDKTLLLDVDGSFPIWVGSDQDRLTHFLGDHHSSLLLVDGQTASPSCLKHLHEKGFRFLVDVPPTRNETWRCIKYRRGSRLWTNDAVTTDVGLVRAGKTLTSAIESVAVFNRDFRVDRPAIPFASGGELESILTVAATVALGQIAWTLWHDREAIDPSLALQRLADLDGRVSFRDDVVRVNMPLGRRSMDLSEGGLLDDVSDVPWFENRTMVFSKG